MKKKSGHYCRICGRHKSNESFTGKGHRTHVCKACQGLSKEQREAIELEDEVFGYLRQSRISEKNVSRLKRHAKSSDAKIAELAKIVLDVAEATPHKKRRLKVLAQKRPGLLRKLDETGLILAHHY